MVNHIWFVFNSCYSSFLIFFTLYLCCEGFVDLDWCVRWSRPGDLSNPVNWSSLGFCFNCILFDFRLCVFVYSSCSNFVYLYLCCEGFVGCWSRCVSFGRPPDLTFVIGVVWFLVYHILFGFRSYLWCCRSYLITCDFICVVRVFIYGCTVCCGRTQILEILFSSQVSKQWLPGYILKINLRA